MSGWTNGFPNGKGCIVAGLLTSVLIIAGKASKQERSGHYFRIQIGFWPLVFGLWFLLSPAGSVCVVNVSLEIEGQRPNAKGQFTAETSALQKIDLHSVLVSH